MMRVVILLAAISPPLLVLGYGIAKGRGSWRFEAMWNAFLVGAVGGIAAIGCGWLIDHLLPKSGNLLLDAGAAAILVAAVPEETIKFFVLVTFAEKHVDVRRLQDLLILAMAVSLGFAMLENFFYVISVDDWRTIASLRAITAVPGHGINGLAMGALLMAARMPRDRRPARIRNALLVPVVLHAAYDFPLLAIEKNVERLWLAAMWLLVIVISSALVITLCNRMLAKAVAADRAAGRDNVSVETNDWLIIGGIAAVAAGPLLAASAVYAKGVELASVATVLAVFPIALGIDSIRTGLKRRKERFDTGRPASLAL